jgi:phage-related protein
MKIVFYKNENGESPMEDFLNSLDPKSRVKTIWVLELLESTRYVSTSFFKKLKGSGDLWEVRVNYSKTSIRIISYLSTFDELVLLHGFIKKSMTIPRKEMIIAQTRRQNHINRHR